MRILTIFPEWRHSRPQSPSFLGHVVGKRLQIKPSGSGDENGMEASEEHLFLSVIWDFSIWSLYTVPQKKFTAFLKVCCRAHAGIKIAWPKIFKIAWLSTFQRRKVSWDTESSRCYSVRKDFHCHSVLRKAKTRGTLKLFLLLFVPVFVCVVFLQFWFT